MTTSTTTAAALALQAALTSAPPIPNARSSHGESFAATIGAVVLAIWLAATVAVMIGAWQPPVPAEIAAATSASATVTTLPCQVGRASAWVFRDGFESGDMSTWSAFVP